MAMLAFIRWSRKRSLMRNLGNVDAKGNAKENGSDAAANAATLSAEGAAANVDGVTASQNAWPASADQQFFQSDLDTCVERLSLSRSLTPREQEILGYLCRGRSTPYICEALTLSKNTVNSHIKRLYIKLDIHNRQEIHDLVEATQRIDQ
jgi:DNA-binding NarL/FixJ family response regulator